jgi:hypothetical protein
MMAADGQGGAVAAEVTGEASAPAVPASGRAWVASKPGGVDTLSLNQVALAALQPHQVRVQVLYSGVGLTDKFVCDGTYIFSSLPATPGYELIGRIVEVGGHTSRSDSPLVCTWQHYVSLVVGRNTPLWERTM